MSVWQEKIRHWMMTYLEVREWLLSFLYTESLDEYRVRSRRHDKKGRWVSFGWRRFSFRVTKSKDDDDTLSTWILPHDWCMFYYSWHMLSSKRMNKWSQRLIILRHDMTWRRRSVTNKNLFISTSGLFADAVMIAFDHQGLELIIKRYHEKDDQNRISWKNDQKRQESGSFD